MATISRNDNNTKAFDELTIGEAADLYKNMGMVFVCEDGKVTNIKEVDE